MYRKVNIEASWYKLLKEEFEKPYFKEMSTFLKSEYNLKKVYPKAKNIFNAFNSTPVESIKVVIIGQDPYHGKGQAHGLCFSVCKDVKPPPSLVNIFKEISADLGLGMPKSGFLQHWADQGVLMLNNVLTVESGKPNSHKNIGWERFTGKVIQNISRNCSKIVFLLWGKNAQNKADLIDVNRHYILKAAHPSPFSAYSGFFGCRHFSKTNNYLIKNGKAPVNWVFTDK